MAMWTHHGRGEEPASESGRYKGKSRWAPQTCLRQAGCALRYRFCDTAEVGVDAENERGRDSLRDYVRAYDSIVLRERVGRLVGGCRLGGGRLLGRRSGRSSRRLGRSGQRRGRRGGCRRGPWIRLVSNRLRWRARWCRIQKRLSGRRPISLCRRFRRAWIPERWCRKFWSTAKYWTARCE